MDASVAKSEVEFESVLAEISTKLLASSPERFEDELTRSIQRLVDHFGADRGAVAFLQQDGLLVVTHHYARPGFVPWPLGPMRGAPNYVERARSGEPVLFCGRDDYPASWAEERATARAFGISALLMFPLRVGDEVIGAVGVSCTGTRSDWNGEIHARFRLFGEIIAGAVVRMRRERELRESLAEVSRLRDLLAAENLSLRESDREPRDADEIVGRSPALQQALHLADSVAPMGTAVLLTGETGTGKDLLARRIHERSARRGQAYVAVNCAALPESLIESELFGYEPGAFTGARQRRLGRFEVANRGTIYLDEIGEMPLDLQGRLLRVLQEGTFERLGSSRTTKVDVRVVAATNRDLPAAVREGRFRADLYYRLRAFPIELPPLRARRDDIPLLVWFFVTRKQGALGRKVTRIPDKAMATLQAYDWPGNVRELEFVTERALILSQGETLALDENLPVVRIPREGTPSGQSLEDVEREHILRVLEETGWRVAGVGGAAERLGLNRSTLRSRMEKLGIRRSSATRA